LKVIFLDFNGVLDTHENMDVINEDNLLRLKNIVCQTDSSVVISSSLKSSFYRTGKLSPKLIELINELETNNIKVIGFTPNKKTREEEIMSYLNRHKEITNYCILDDDYEMESLKHNLVKLPSQMNENQVGLDDESMNLAIKILKRSGRSI